jgi:polysaccharide export outer membrane protein
MPLTKRALAALVTLGVISVTPRLAFPSQQEGNRAFTTSQGVPEYLIGAGDELRIRIWTGVEAKTYEVVVQADGTIFLPFVGLASLDAGDRSALELRDRIVERLGASYREPAAEVVVTERVARLVTIMGEVRSIARGDSGPGRYPLPGRIRLVDFITEHGGFTDQADLNNTQLMRDSQTHVYNLSRAIFQSDDSQNPVLDAGDLVYVPPLSTSSRKLLIFGEVGTPGLLAVSEDVPLAEALALSGGLTKNAHKSGLVVVRGGIEKPMILVSNFEALQKGDLSQNFMVQDGDMIFVGRRKLATFTDIMHAFALPLGAIYTTILISNAASSN